jgi:3-hydroxyacyl-CoA dehydrogenase
MNGSSKFSMDAQKIYITGEPLCVNEYAAECAQHGHSVSIMYTADDPHNPFIKRKNITRVHTPPKNTTIAIELTNCNHTQKKKNIQALDTTLAPTAVILCSACTITVTECAGWLKKPRIFIGISAFPTLIRKNLVELSVPAHHTDQGVENVRTFFSSLEKETAFVDDRVGMVMPRILGQVINEAIIASTQQLASPKVIDAAMKLGADYPHGPIEWLNAITARQTVALLDALYHDIGDERYAAAPLLRKMAASGEFWKKD